MDVEVLLALASPDGAFTSGQALRSGVTRPALAKLVKDSRIRRLARDIYTFATEPTDVIEQHRELLAAAMHKYGDRIMAAGNSALIAHDLPTYNADLSTARLLWRNGASTRVVGPLHIARPTRQFPHATANSIQAVTEPVAFLQVAAWHGMLPAIIAGDAMLHRETCTERELAEICAIYASYPGRAVAEKALRYLEPLTESPGESILRIIAAQAGIVMEPQFKVYDGDELIARTDFRIVGSRALVEFDGKLKYGGPENLWGEKQREDRIRRLHFGVERVIWKDFHTPRALVHRLRAAATDHPDWTAA